MIIKFTQDHEVNGRLYLAGESRDFDATSAQKLIADGVAVDPEKAKGKTVEVETPVIPLMPTETPGVTRTFTSAAHAKKPTGK